MTDRGENVIRRGYKLMRRRRNGTLGPLFIDAKKVIEPGGPWMPAEAHRTPGFQFRPGWRVLLKPVAPHLTKQGRVWVEVEVMGAEEHVRPENQGGRWLLAQQLRVVRVLNRSELSAEDVEPVSSRLRKAA